VRWLGGSFGFFERWAVRLGKIKCAICAVAVFLQLGITDRYLRCGGGFIRQPITAV